MENSETQGIDTKGSGGERSDLSNETFDGFHRKMHTLFWTWPSGPVIQIIVIHFPVAPADLVIPSTDLRILSFGQLSELGQRLRILIGCRNRALAQGIIKLMFSLRRPRH